MMWVDIAMIVFACTAANHLGLIDAAERILQHRLPIINCPKCCSFWASLLFCLNNATCGALTTVAISFFASISAIWLELAMGFMDALYNKTYERIYNKTAVETAAGHKDSSSTKDTVNTKDEVPEMQLNESDFD